MIAETTRQSIAKAPGDEALLLIDETKLPDRRNYPETGPDYCWRG
jgi:hypothetical protein